MSERPIILDDDVLRKADFDSLRLLSDIEAKHQFKQAKMGKTYSSENAVKERPIGKFTPEEIRAILEGRKTQTRRVLRPNSDNPFQTICPYGHPGDRLWVRETFTYAPSGMLMYRADKHPASIHWKSPLFMPRKISRILLEIVSVRVQRLQDISEEDAKAEGFPFGCDSVDWFKEIWQSINGTESWDANPWVWVIEFRRVQE